MGIHNLACMVCKPGTHQVIDHFLLYYNQAFYEPWLWYWLCNYMEFDERAEQSEVKASAQSKIHRYLPFIFPKPNWPAWMEEAASASSLEALIEIKQRHNQETTQDAARLARILSGEMRRPGPPEKYTTLTDEDIEKMRANWARMDAIIAEREAEMEAEKAKLLQQEQALLREIASLDTSPPVINCSETNPTNKKAIR